MVAVTVSLGNWQTRRAEQKLQAQEHREERAGAPALDLPAFPVRVEDFADIPVRARGEFKPAHTLYLDNKVLRGMVGYHVLTPLKIAGGNLHVIVNRGWVAAGARREDLPPIRTPPGEVSLEGFALVPARFHYELGSDTGAGPVVQNLALDRMGERTGLSLQPIVLYQTSDSGDGLLRAWQRADSGADTHRGYALQWYLLAALTMVLYVTYSFRRVD
jgi:surfeit locus 1 family protein